MIKYYFNLAIIGLHQWDKDPKQDPGNRYGGPKVSAGRGWEQSQHDQGQHHGKTDTYVFDIYSLEFCLISEIYCVFWLFKKHNCINTLDSHFSNILHWTQNKKLLFEVNYEYMCINIWRSKFYICICVTSFHLSWYIAAITYGKLPSYFKARA